MDVLFVVAALLLALWLDDRQGWRLAAAAVLLAGATLNEARRHPVRGRRARGRRRVVAARAADWPRLARRGARRRCCGRAVAHVVPRADERRGARRPGLGVGADRAVDALRLSLDVLFERRAGLSSPSVSMLALAAGSSGAIGVSPRTSRSPRPPRSRRRLVDGRSPSSDHGGRGRNPIVRYTGALVLLAAAAMPLLLVVGLAKGRGSEALTHRSASVSPRTIVAVPLVGVSTPRRGGRSAASRRPTTASRSRVPRTRASSTSCSDGGTRRAEADELLDRVRGVGYVDAGVVADGCWRWKVLYDGIERTSRGSSRARRRAARVSRPSSSSNRPADPYDSPS